LRAQVTPSASVERLVSWRASPPLTAIVQTWDLPPRVEIKAIDPPSGDQRGRVSDPSPAVSCFGSPPSVLISQMWLTTLLA